MSTTWEFLMRMGQRHRLAIAVAAVAIAACKPSEILDVPPPAGLSIDATATQSGAEGLFAGERGQIFGAFAGNLLQWTDVMTDEFTWSFFTYGGTEANMDARRTAATTAAFTEAGDNAITQLLTDRSSMLIAINGLRGYASDSSKVGEGYALIGYTELLMAEDYCAGVPLSHAVIGGGVVYGRPTTMDSLLNIAVGHFDSALAYSGGSATVQQLASVGLGRAQMDLGNYSAAQTAVGNVTTSFAYNAELQPTYSGPPYVLNVYAQMLQGCGTMTVSEQEGGNGLNFVSANDVRLVFDSTTAHTCDNLYAGVAGTLYYPMKFGEPSSLVPMATGIEARLDEAEAALAGGSPNTWLTDLNALRTNGVMTVDTLPGPVIDTTWGLGTGQVSGQTAGLRPLTDPGTPAAELALMFRERAFWLFGTGTRLGDLRRLVRQYQMPRESVYPTGSYATSPAIQTFLQAAGVTLTSYGTDASMTLPTSAGTSNSTTANPNYVGCLTSTGDA